ncbi:MAG: NifU N-terminal domain-containing protein, partial [Bdellovibrionales bacterium]|nr:NifU N-terminal domain-containing protein [Bdellovibrionales bacterium]
MMSKPTVTYESTPNPQSMKFNFPTQIAEESVEFSDAGA